MKSRTEIYNNLKPCNNICPDEKNWDGSLEYPQHIFWWNMNKNMFC